MSEQTHPPIYTMQFEELEERANNGETLVSACGYLICSRDRKFNRSQAWDIWNRETLAAIEDGKISAPAGGVNMTKRVRKGEPMSDPRPLNKKGRPFSWSFSALNNFEGCPKRYAHEKFYCDVPFVESEAIIWGNRVHKAAEDYVNGLPITDPEAFKEVEKYAKLFKNLKDKGAEVTPELEIVLDRNMKPLLDSKAWFSKEAWFRAKLDVPVIQGTKVGVYDYKTGAKPKDDDDQLKICCAALSILRPDLEDFVPKLIWTKHDLITGCNPATFTKAECRQIWANVLPRVKRMEEAWRTENFVARPSGLCKWKTGQCPVYDKCEYARG